MKAHWQGEKQAIQKIRTLKEQIEEARRQEQQAEREGNLAKVAEIRYGKISELQQKLEKENQALAAQQKEQKMLKEEVDAEDVAEVVAKWTNIPVSKMMEGEIEKLLKMESSLKNRTCRTPIAPSGLLSSSAPPGWGKPNWLGL
jgi:ATP-dependent Clp protease ATP-binding subunit ClpB